jgi:hypothetical protein
MLLNKFILKIVLPVTDYKKVYVVDEENNCGSKNAFLIVNCILKYLAVCTMVIVFTV